MSIPQAVTAALTSTRYLATNEKDLQQALESHLLSQGIPVVREWSLSTGIIDLYLPGPCVGIEVKIKGSTASVIRQLHRYVRDGSLKYVMLATTNRRLAAAIPSEITGTPITVILLDILR